MADFNAVEAAEKVEMAADAMMEVTGFELIKATNRYKQLAQLYNDAVGFEAYDVNFTWQSYERQQQKLKSEKS